MPIYDGDERIGAMGMLISFDSNRLKQALPAQEEGGPTLYNSLSRTSSFYTFNDYIGEHPSAIEVLEQCRQAATSA